MTSPFVTSSQYNARTPTILEEARHSDEFLGSRSAFNFDDAKQTKGSGQVAEPSKSASHAADRAEAAATSPVAFTRTQELLGEAREVCAILTADK